MNYITAIYKNTESKYQETIYIMIGKHFKVKRYIP